MAATLPRTLTAGTPENVNHVQENFEYLRDYVNGANIEETNLASSSVSNTKLAANAVTTDKVTDGTLLDTDLASPNNGVYRVIHQVGGAIHDGVTAATWALTYGGQLTAFSLASAGSYGVSAFHITSGDYAVAGKTTKLNVKASIFTNATAAAVTLTFGIAPVTAAAGAADQVALTLGADSGSAAQWVNPAASSILSSAGADIDLPATGFYAPYIASTGTVAADARIVYNLVVRIRHV